jgi:hypothetical protein
MTGPEESVEDFYSDNSGELIAVAQELGWRHSTSTPGLPQSNGRAERSVRTVLEGTRSLLLASGLPRKWWSRASKAFCVAFNATNTNENGKTPWELRFGQQCPIQLIPFGSMIWYLPATEKATTGENKFGPNAKPGIFMGYFMNPGSAWSRDYLVIDKETVDEHGFTPHTYVHRTNTVHVPKGPPTYPYLNHDFSKKVPNGSPFDEVFPEEVVGSKPEKEELLNDTPPKIQNGSSSLINH